MQGGGELHMFYASSQPLPDGPVVLYFASPSTDQLKIAPAERVNPFVCVAEIPGTVLSARE